MLSLTHWGRLTHICVSKFTVIGLDDGLSPGRNQSIIWTNAGVLLIEPLVQFIYFNSRKCISICCLWNVGHLSRPQYVNQITKLSVAWDHSKILKTAFSDAFSWEKSIFIYISWNFYCYGLKCHKVSTGSGNETTKIHSTYGTLVFYCI